MSNDTSYFGGADTDDPLYGHPYCGSNPVYPFGRCREDYLEKKSKRHYILLGFDIKDRGDKWEVTNDEGHFVTEGETLEDAMTALEKEIFKLNNYLGGGISG